MTINKIYDLREGNCFDQNDVQKIDLLLQAITDWPTSVVSIEDFLMEVKLFLKADTLTYESISLALKKLNPKIFHGSLNH